MREALQMLDSACVRRFGFHLGIDYEVMVSCQNMFG